jgi:L-threonylcarbamoyladenylate synthase
MSGVFRYFAISNSTVSIDYRRTPMFAASYLPATITRMKNIVTIEQALAIVGAGGIGVMPTDTLYGVVASASDRIAVRRLYALKQRDRKPGTLIAASIEQLVALGIEEKALRQNAHWWPNSISVVLPASDDLEYLHVGLDSLPIRIPKPLSVRSYLTSSGPLLTSSANQPGQPSATTIDEAYAYFGDRVDFYVDGGVMPANAASTIIRPNGGSVEILRQGAVKID